MTFYFAWVNPEDDSFDPAYQREDEEVLAFSMDHAEGDFPALTIDVVNPRVGLLAPTRKRWAWLSWDDGDQVRPLFFGRLVGAPEGSASEILTLTLIARPRDYADQKEALADQLRELPFYDPIWVTEEERANPDVVLEARSALWHIDRITHDVTVSDIIIGEETADLGDGHFRESLQLEYSGTPARQARVTADVAWQQEAQGEVDVSRRIGQIETWTGQSLVENWPQVGRNFGGGWTLAEAERRRLNIESDRLRIEFDAPARAYFDKWRIGQTTVVGYDVARSYVERVAFTLDAGLQPMIVDPDQDDRIEIDVTSSAVADEIDGDLPIRDVRRRSYLQTDRGEQSIAHLIALARAQLLARARCVSATIEMPFADAIGLSCRHSVTISDERLPGGTLSGKVSQYSFGLSGNDGAMTATVTISCTVGEGGDLSETIGVPTYVEAGYVDPGYQRVEGGLDLFPGEDLVWALPVTPIRDDGTDFFSFGPDEAVLRTEIINDAETVRPQFDGLTFDTINEARAAMDDYLTRVEMDLKPIDRLAFETDYEPIVEPLVVPKTIDLGASANG